MQLTNVIIKPYLTEKTYSKRSQAKKQYAFIVDMNANKADIALAFASIFEIEPENVKTMVRKPVATRTGTLHPGFTKAFKIAYITLPKGKDIALSKQETEEKAKADAKKAAAKPVEAKATIKEKTTTAKVEAKEQPKVEVQEKKTAWRKQTNKNH